MKKSLFHLLVMLLICVMAFPAFADENSVVVQVGTSDELIEALMGDAIEIVFTDDIVLTPDFGTHFKPNGNSSYYTPVFTFENKTIDGQGHALTMPNYAVYPTEYNGNDVYYIDYPFFAGATFKNFSLLDLSAGAYEKRQSFTGAKFQNCHLTGNIIPTGAIIEIDSDYDWVFDTEGDGFWREVPVLDQSMVIDGRVDSKYAFEILISPDPYYRLITETETIISGTGYLGVEELTLNVRKPLTYTVNSTEGYLRIKADAWDYPNFAEEGFVPVIIQTTLEKHNQSLVYNIINGESVFVDLEIELPALSMNKSERSDEEWIALAEKLTEKIDLSGLKMKDEDEPVIGICLTLNGTEYKVWNGTLYEYRWW